MLRPIDLLVILKVAAVESEGWSQMRLAKDLGVSPSSVNAALERATIGHLYSSARKTVRKKNLYVALKYGSRYFFAIELGPRERGVPTASGAAPLAEILIQIPDAIPVWPDPEGKVRGPAIEPLHPSAPQAALADPKLYRLLALLDSIRIGDARERALAAEALREELGLEGLE